jgi:spermidine/putrescine transport system substrate-binding protein
VPKDCVTIYQALQSSCGYLCPNTAALKKVSPEFLSNPAVIIPEAVRAKSEVIQDLGPDLAKYTKVWDAVKR